MCRVWGRVLTQQVKVWFDNYPNLSFSNMSSYFEEILLPREIWLMIFEKLPFRDLFNVVLVSKNWLDIGEDPLLWKNFKMVKSCRSLDSLEDALGISRLSSLSYLELKASVKEGIVLNDHIEVISKTNIKSMRMLNCNLSYANPEMISALFNNFKSLELEDTVLTEAQAEMIFTTMAQQTMLKELKLSTPLSEEISISLLAPELLGAAFNKLEVLHLRWVIFDQGFWETFFQMMCADTNLRELLFEYQGLHNVPPKVFSAALNKLQIVDLSQIDVDHSQCRALIEAIARDTKIEHLDISSNNLATIDPDILAEAVNKLRKVDISNTNLTSCQIERILKGINFDSKLKDLDIDQNRLIKISPDLLASAANNLERVVLSKLTTVQTARIFDVMSKFSTLKHLSIQDVSFLGNSDNALDWEDGQNPGLNQYGVDENMIAKAINKLTSVDLSFGSFNNNQAQAIFEAMADKTCLKELFLQQCDLISVNPSIVCKAITKLHKVFLHSANLSKSQIFSLFLKMNEKSNIKDFDLSNSDLSLIEPAIIANVVYKLEKVFLTDAILTTDQLTAIFTRIADNPSYSNLLLLDVTRNDVSQIDEKLLENVKKAVHNFNYDSHNEMNMVQTIDDEDSEENYSEEDGDNVYNDTEDETSEDNDSD